jgi:thiol-disulfide isomerase/thioredoxin
VQAADFVEQVEQVDPRVAVVVHLFESGVSSCLRMNRLLDELAAQWPHVKFLRMNASHYSLCLSLCLSLSLSLTQTRTHMH